MDHSYVPRLVSDRYSLDAKETEIAFWGFADKLCRGDITPNEFNDTIREKLKIKDSSFDWTALNNEKVVPIPESHQLLENIAKHLPVGLLSDTWPGLPEFFHDNKIVPAIDYAVEIYSHKIKSVKPEEKIMRQAEIKSKTKPKNILFVDDKQVNVAGAKKRGWHGVIFDPQNVQLSVEKIMTYLGSHPASRSHSSF